MSKSGPIFAEIGLVVASQGLELQKKLKGVIKFEILNGGGNWLLDLKNGSGSLVENGTGKADLTIKVNDDDFALLYAGKLNPQQAFMKGKIKIKGNMGLAMKFGNVLTETKKLAAAAPAAPAAAASAGGKSAPFFEQIGAALATQGADLVRKTNGRIQWNIKSPDAQWHLDLKSGNGSLTQGSKAADITITVKDEDFFALAQGKLNPQQAFMKGKIKIKGNMGLAMKLNTVLAAARPKANL